MTCKFKFDLGVLKNYKTSLTVRRVIASMGGLKVKEFPMYEKSKSGSIAQHRINEIEELADFGTAYCGAVWYIKHHTIQAIEALNSHITQWEVIASHLGRIDPFERTQKLIKTSRDRLEPVFYACEKELDPTRSVRCAYEQIELFWLNKLEFEKQINLNLKINASTYRKRAIREFATKKAKESLVGFYDDLNSWFDEIRAQI